MAQGMRMRTRIKTWKLFTGNLVNMTSDNTPSGFRCTTWQWPTAGSAWSVFDSNITGSALVCSHGGWSRDYGAELHFPKPIKIVSFYRNYGANNQKYWKGLLEGLTLEDKWITISRHDTPDVRDITLPVPSVPVKAIRFVTYGRHDLHTWINGIRITKWYQR